MFKSYYKNSIIAKLGVMALVLATANCSGKTYSTFFQPFDLVFGARANSSVSVALLTATPLTNTRVMLTFSKPVTLASGQLVGNYRITDSTGNALQILAASRDPNNSNIIFIDTIPQTAGGTYTAVASNIVGVDGSSLGSSNSATFTAPNNADQTGPAFGSVSAINATTVEVYFSEAVAQTVNNATFGGYFDLYTNAGCSTGNVDVTSAARDTSNYAKVTLTSAAMTSGTTYYVCASTNVRDIWGNANAAPVASGSFVYNAPTPRVVSAVSSSATSLLVTFDQAMTTTGGFTTPGNYTFTGCGVLSATGATVTAVGTTQALLTSLTTGTAGTCTVTVNTAITSALGGALTAATNKALFTYTSSTTTDTVAPSVVGVTTTNSTTVVVTFSENVTGASIADFNLSPALNITNVNCVGNVCTLTTDPQSTTPYSLSITNNDGGIQDTATPTANTLSTGSTTFTGDGRPYIVAIYPVDSGTVMVEWSEPITNNASVNTTDYAIATGATITAAALDPAGTDPSKFVKLTISPVLTSGTSYTLTYTDGAPTSADTTGNGTLTTVPGGGTFTGPTATTAPQVTTASSTAPTVVIVNFNEPLNNSTIDTTDFVLTGAGCPTVVGSASQIAAGVVQLVVTSTAPASAATCTATVTAASVSDLAGNAIAGTNNSATYSYTGTNAGTPDTTAPTIASAVAISNTEVRIYFSEPVSTTGGATGTNSGSNPANYSFSPTLTGGVQSITCTATYCSVTLNAPGTSAVGYSVTISNIQDQAAPANTMASASVNFSGIGSSVTAPTLYQAVLINSTTVELSFSEQMDLASSQTVGNYAVTGGNTVSAAVRQADTTKVRLTLSPGAYGSSNSYTVTASTLTDTAGNTIGTPNSATFSGSATAPSAASLAAASDTGTVGDNITGAAFPSPGLQFTGTTTANTTVYLYDDGVLVATAVSNASGAYTVTLASNTTVGQGANIFTVATVGPTGLVSDISPGVTITYDSSVPAAPAALDLVVGSDTGVSTTDNITSSATPSFTVTCETGSSVQLYTDNPAAGTATGSAVTCSGGTATLTAATLGSGVHNITVRQTDVAGNQSVASGALSVTVDTTAPALNTHPLTGNTTLTLTFAENVYNSTGGNLATTDFAVAFASNGGATSASITGITHTAPSGTVVLTLSYVGIITGTETITVTNVANAVIDVAGNAANVTTGAKTLSAIGVASITGTPTYTAVAPVSGGTTGYISITWSEGVYTNTGAAGAVVAGDFTVAFTQNSGNSTAAVVSCVTDTASTSCPGTAPAAGATSMRLQITNTGATSGVETIQVSAATGEIHSATNGLTPNTVNTGTLTFPDRFAPSAPGTADMVSGTDSGTSNSDNYTSNQTPQFTVSCETGATVQLYTDNPVAGTATGSTGTCAAGTVTLTAGTLAAGAHNISARQTDAASNQSVASTGLAVTIDTGNPAVTGTPDLQAASDLGSSSTDNLTNDTTPTFDLACETNASVQLYVDAVATGSAATCAAGTVTLTTGILGEGARSITAIQTDPAGNASAASGALSVTIDTTATAATGTPDLANGSDTGSSNSDNITNDTTPTFDVSCVNGTSVQLFVDAVASGTAATCAGGTVNLTTAALTAGTRSITAVQTDPAGNASVASSALSITLDTTADAATGTPDLQAASDLGSSSTDNVTNDTTPTFDISCVTGSSVQLYSDAVASGTAATCAGGTVALTTGALAAGARSITAIQTDPAGNASVASSALSVTIDTGTPAAPAALNLADADDTGTSNSDNITRNTTALTIDGTSEANATIRIYLTSSAGTLLQTVTASGGGVWSGDITLAEGVNSVVVTATDAGGNASADSTGLSITVDTTAPTNQDTVYAASSSRLGGGSVTIVSSGTASNRVWFAPSGTTTFAAGATMTEAASGTATSILAPATAGSYKLFVIDLAGNISSESTATLTVDNTAPTISSVAPATNAFVNTANVSYTINENCASGSVVWTRTGGTADVNHTQALTGAELTAGTKTNITLTNNPTLVSGAIYTVAFNCTDAAGNAATAVSSTNVTFDTTLPVISAVTPATGATVNSTSVSYTLSEICESGTITWTRTGGTADGSSPYTRALTGSELNAGTFTGTITNNPTLVDGSIYSVAFNCSDRAGNAAAAVTSTGVTYSPGVLQITTATTLDTDNDGKIDTYRVGFNKSVNDSTFPGYSANALGSVTTHWLVAGYNNVRILHGTAVTFATDTVNDSVIYIRFDENVLDCTVATQVGCDTDSKPDLTTTTDTPTPNPRIEDLTTAKLSPVNTAAVTEADGARPTLVAARSLSATSVDAIFSEPVDTVEAQLNTNYSITGGTNPTVSAAVRDGTNTNIVHLTTAAQTGGQAYTLMANTNVKDLANFNLNSSANTAAFNGVVDPVVSSIVTTSATTLTITFNESVTAASAECANQTACALIYQNLSLPVLTAVSTAGSGNNAATYTLTVNPMIEGQAYTTSVLATKIVGVAAPAGRYVSSPNNAATFNGDGKPAANISPDTQTQCPTPTNLPPSASAATRVVVQYDQTVGATATTGTNYKITGCITGVDCASGTGAPNSAGASVVTSMGGNKYAVDFTQSFDTDTSQYQLTVTGVQDSNGNTIALPGTMSFRCGTDTTPPSLISASVVAANAGSTVILLTFSESVDNVTANVAGNYKYDAQAYGTGVSTAARQSNTAQVQLTFVPALSNGGHQIRVQNVTDLQANIILDNGVNNVQPVIVNAPTGFTGGPVFTDPFGDGTTAGTIIIYDSKLYLGADTAASKLFEMNYGLTTAQTITLDADGTFGSPFEDFSGYTSRFSGCTTDPTSSGTCAPQEIIAGIDTLYAACIGGSSTPRMTGSACTGASGVERMFIGALNTMGNYRSFWQTSDKSSTTTTFAYAEQHSGDSGGAAAYRSANMLLFKDQLWINFGAELGGGGRGGRVCMNASGCSDGLSYLGSVGFTQTSRIRRIGANNANTLRNGSYNGGGAPYADTNVSNQAYNAISALYEYDNDGVGANESQLYMANGGYTNSTLGSARTGNSDGGIVRSVLAYSTKASLPANCPTDSSGCNTYWEDLTPDANTKWNTYISIPFPQNTQATGSGNCGTSFIEMDCVLPYNLFVPALKAVPYMRTAPNGDLYMLRNACSTNGFATNGGSPDFRTVRQVCPSGSEIPQLWMLPANCGNAAACATAWQLVAEYSTTGKTNMAANTGSCGTSPNQCLVNTHVSLLEFVGNYLYVGFDNATYGANVWRVDMTSVASGSLPAQTSFSIVNLPGIESGGGGTNQKIFSHVTVNDAGKDWLVIITRDGSNAMKIYRTANDQN